MDEAEIMKLIPHVVRYMKRRVSVELNLCSLPGLRALPIFALEGWRGLSSRQDGPLIPWPRGTCREQGDAIRPVSDAHASKCSQPFGRASLWLRGTVGEDVCFRSPGSETKRRRYHHSRYVMT